MCVVVIVPEGNVRPTADMLKACWTGNPDGGGLGWVERREALPGLVKWRKGITTVEEMIEANKTLPKPYVLHFRIPSVGGRSKELTHPFPLSEEAECDMEGSSERGVLFHNGTWGKWEERLLQFTFGTGTPLPDGQWSDTRAMAYLAYHLSPNILEFIDEKIAILVPEGPEGVPDVLTWGHWNVDNGIITSNTFWKNRLGDSDRRWLPAHYGGHRSSSSNSSPNNQSNVSKDTGVSRESGPKELPAPIRQHNGDCICADCVDERVGAGAVLLSNPTLAGETSANKVAAPGKITLNEIKTKYHAMSKNKLRRLRKKEKHNPKQISTMEKWVLRYSEIQDRKKINEKLSQSGQGHLIMPVPAMTLH